MFTYIYVELEFTIQLLPTTPCLTQNSSHFPPIWALGCWQFIKCYSYFQVFRAPRSRAGGLSHIHCHQLAINTRLFLTG